MTEFQTIFLIICTIIFASMIGAYYGTIDYRIRNDLPLVTSHCYCPLCNHELALYHQLPILGWFILGGKCHYCHAPIPFRYPLFEGGYTLFYFITFLIFADKPLLYSGIWVLFYTFIMLIRCQKHYKSMIKGLCIITLYHLLYCGLMFIIQSAIS